MPVTLKDIANKLGVSPSTVSRALSGRGHISLETRVSVLRIAEELGYVPDILARGLVGAPTNILACLVLELSNPFFVPVVQAVEDIADEKSYIAIISESKRQLELEKRLIERFRRIHVDGIIITPTMHSLDHLEAIKAGGTPIILVGRRYTRLDYITVDDVKGGRIAGQHLVGLGHTCIGTLSSGEPHNNAEQDRIGGFRQVLDEAGLQFREDWALEVGNNRIDGGALGAERWLSMSERPSAIFALNDMLAIGFVHRLRQEGVRVPDDVAVVGFDDMPFAQFCEVPLTTIAYPKYEMGRMAAEMLLERIQAFDRVQEVEHVLLQPKLVIRQSCGARGA